MLKKMADQIFASKKKGQDTKKLKGFIDFEDEINKLLTKQNSKKFKKQKTREFLDNKESIRYEFLIIFKCQSFYRKKEDSKESGSQKQQSKRTKKKLKVVKTKNVPESEIMLKFLLNIINSLKKSLPHFFDMTNRPIKKVDIGEIFYP